jgi:hypothetical protein
MARYAALLVAAGGRGSARVPTCERTLRHARTWASMVYDKSRTWRRGVGDLSPVVVRALSFFGPGELRALRVEDPKVFRLVSSMMQACSDGGAPTSPMAQALNSLCTCDLHHRALCNHDDGTDGAAVRSRVPIV